eukprot:9128813-Alexandrium_andersonii.AAC.1
MVVQARATQLKKAGPPLARNNSGLSNMSQYGWGNDFRVFANDHTDLYLRSPTVAANVMSAAQLRST